MLALRKGWIVLVGVWSGAFFAHALFDWVLGLEGLWLRVPMLAAALVGGIVGMGEARQVRPMPAAERRDTILGWTALVGGVATAACFAAPFPWGVLAAAVIFALTIVALRHIPGARGDERDGSLHS